MPQNWVKHLPNEVLSAYLKNELGEKDQEALQIHLLCCETCNRQFALMEEGIKIRKKEKELFDSELQEMLDLWKIIERVIKNLEEKINHWLVKSSWKTFCKRHKSHKFKSRNRLLETEVSFDKKAKALTFIFSSSELKLQNFSFFLNLDISTCEIILERQENSVQGLAILPYRPPHSCDEIKMFLELM